MKTRIPKLDFSWTISIGDILKTLMVAAAFFVWGVTVETRFTEHDGMDKQQAFQIVQLEKRMDRTDRRMENTVGDIKEALIRIEKKIDKK